jgi:hypothetical protein
VLSRTSAHLNAASARVVAAAIATFACATPSWGAEPPAPASDVERGEITELQISKAMQAVRADPNMSLERKITTLKWVKSEKEKERQKDASWMQWLREFFSWFAQNGRFLFWGVIAVLVGLLLVYLWRLIRAYGLPERTLRVEAPSFVRDLDIRPESLPDDIGGTARRLWDEGEQRGALALLYRGLLSRLVHVHRVPIRDSSTEGDCIALASRHLTTEERKIFVSSLVRVWQRAVYGGETIATESVHALCDEFAHALDEAAASTLAPGAQPAGASA